MQSPIAGVRTTHRCWRFPTPIQNIIVRSPRAEKITCVLRFCQPRDASEYTANTSAMKLRRKRAAVGPSLSTSLLVFGSPARSPSEDCGFCLLTKFGFSWSAIRLLVHSWGDDGWCTAFDVFDAR